MNHSTSTSNRRLVVYSGIGALNYTTRDEGLFQVRSGFICQEFDTLLKAYFYYITLNGETSLWDVTNEQVLVESRTEY
jgi:hypothetical protein